MAMTVSGRHVLRYPEPRHCSVPGCTGWAFYRVARIGFCEGHKAEARRAAGGNA